MTESGWEGSYLYRLMLASCGGAWEAEFMRDGRREKNDYKKKLKSKQESSTHTLRIRGTHVRQQLLLRCGRCQRRKKKLALLSIARLEPKGKENTDHFFLVLVRFSSTATTTIPLQASFVLFPALPVDDCATDSLKDVE